MARDRVKKRQLIYVQIEATARFQGAREPRPETTRTFAFIVST